MNGQQYFSKRASENSDLARHFARADAELDFAQELRTAREGRGLTQQQLAERMGVTQSVVARLEQAGRSPCLPTLLSRNLSTLLRQFLLGIREVLPGLHQAPPPVALRAC
jgi:ribosome-binding protein aMBF1 (putative translation factor)